MKYKRLSGVLLHPTSFPGPYGIGDIGPGARYWIDFLSSSGSTLWQVLPLGPTGYGDSPYQCFSAFAGNPLLISPIELLNDDLLHPNDIIEKQTFPTERVDYGNVIPYKLGILDRSFIRFKKRNPKEITNEFETFKEHEKHWLDDFTLFMAIKEVHGGVSWVNWPSKLRSRHPVTIKDFRKKHASTIERHAYRQFIFYRQWRKLKDYANSKNIKIIGDIPIFVAHDSADVWSHPNLFFLDKTGNPTVVAGVPPDYFSPTGQLWGNPLYRWKEHAKNEYSWWKQRFSAVLKLVDIVRLDHFRGFAGYWEIPASDNTAMNGKWVPGPGAEFFDKILYELGDLPILAEDLGEITPDVIELRDRYHFPSMKILVFAFTGDSSNKFLPHNYTQNNVVYTGTHDNDTVLGWYQRVDEKERDFARRYLARDGNDINWDLIRAAWSSVAIFAIAPIQDLLGLDNSARMNYPSSPSGNWTWRMNPEALNEPTRKKLAELNILYGRKPIS